MLMQNFEEKKIIASQQIYVFRRADYEYNSENCRLADCLGKNHENLMEIMVFGVCLSQYGKFFKMFRI